MLRRLLPGLAATVCLLFLCWPGADLSAQPAGEPQWIWFDEGNPLVDAPAETRYFRRAFTIARGPIVEASLAITADNAYTVWVNGAEIGHGNEWSRLDTYDVKRHLVKGKNVIAVAAHNEGGPAGLVVRLTYAPTGSPKLSLVSDGAWKASRSATGDWKKLDFADRGWSKARVLGGLGKVGPWLAGAAPGKRGPGRFTVPAGFKVEEVVKRPDDRGPFSLVNMTFDAKGRLLLSQEGGPILICTDPDKKGVWQKVRPYCDQIKNSHGMCWVKDALYLVGNGPKGTGLYRCRDTKGADEIDEVTLVHRFNGGMGEHGPHAVRHGPDGKLYVVIGNHAWANIGKHKGKEKLPNPERLAANSPLLRWPTGGMGPDQGQPGSTEDVLLPRLNDARGHAANILAPGGTIWRLDADGKNMALVAAGFRNHFDAAFNPAGELFTFDSDMEWDENLPWYRAVRAAHCPPGADFVWRTGAANTPNYYLDSLPPLAETGRGSPVGVEFYDHSRYPQKYRGAFFMADWSLGLIYAVHLKRRGATYAAEVEKFCQGAPMNVTDLEVGPDGAIYFTMGGRGTQGGVYRIVSTDEPAPADLTHPGLRAGVDPRLVTEQPLSAWSRASIGRVLSEDKDYKLVRELRGIAQTAGSVPSRLRALTLLQIHGRAPAKEDLVKLTLHSSADIRAHAVWALGVNGHADAKATLIAELKDPDALVRRRACEALVRLNVEPPIEALWALLGDGDQFVRTAARRILERADAKKWVGKMEKEADDRTAYEGIVALCTSGRALEHAEAIYGRLERAEPKGPRALLDYARTVQLALFHAPKAPDKAVKEVARRCDGAFPTAKFVNRELAIVLTHLKRTKQIDLPVHTKLLAALEASAGDREQQIHYFYCLRLLHEGWTTKQKADLAAWYEGTSDWRGGHSFTPFLENIFRECLSAYDVADRRALLQNGEKAPLVALVLAQRLQNDRQAALLPDLKALVKRLGKVPREKEVREALTDAVLRTAQEHPGAESYSDLIAGLSSPNKVVLFDVIGALRKSAIKPKADEAGPYRAALLASRRLDKANRWAVVELLRHWSGGRQFGAEDKDWQPELRAWDRWFAQAFPKEPALPDVASERPAPSKYKFDELLAFLTRGEGGKGNPARGRLVFDKAQCAKCHKYGAIGEGVGPDLTALAKRFKRVDVLESIVHPSKVISDQYRSTTIVTKRGQQITGLVADQPDVLNVLLSDGTKVTVRKRDVENRFASLVSVMPEGLLEALSKEEIADLFAFMESDPPR